LLIQICSIIILEGIGKWTWVEKLWIHHWTTAHKKYNKICEREKYALIVTEPITWRPAVSVRDQSVTVSVVGKGGPARCASRSYITAMVEMTFDCIFTLINWFREWILKTRAQKNFYSHHWGTSNIFQILYKIYLSTKNNLNYICYKLLQHKKSLILKN